MNPINPAPDIDTTVGDTSPDQVFTVYRGAQIVSLAGASVDFLLYDPNTKLQTNIGGDDCTVNGDGTAGQCTYKWGPNDKTDPGVYRGYLQITFANGEKETAQVRVNVKPIGF